MTLSELLGSLFGWLAQFVEWLVSFCPRYEVIQYNERGVLYSRGQKPRALKPGIRWYVPAFSSIETHHVCTQVLDVAAITVETSCGVQVSAGMVVTYKITDVYQYEVENLDADAGISEVAEGALRKLIVRKTMEELRDHRQPLDDSLATVLHKALEPFGVTIESARLTDLARCRVLRHFGLRISQQFHSS